MTVHCTCQHEATPHSQWQIIYRRLVGCKPTPHNSFHIDPDFTAKRNYFHSLRTSNNRLHATYTLCWLSCLRFIQFNLSIPVIEYFLHSVNNAYIHMPTCSILCIWLPLQLAMMILLVIHATLYRKLFSCFSYLAQSAVFLRNVTRNSKSCFKIKPLNMLSKTINWKVKQFICTAKSNIGISGRLSLFTMSGISFSTTITYKGTHEEMLWERQCKYEL